MKINRPLIGITMDYVDPAVQLGTETYSKVPWYALRQKYCEAVALAGGIPFGLPYQMGYIQDYEKILDGLLITGGEFDIDPSLYGSEEHHKTLKLKPNRTQFEAQITRHMLDHDKPVLGICGGMQLLNVLHEGTLYQDLPSEHLTHINHLQTHDRNLPQHTVTIEPNTLLGQFSIESKNVNVNSSHHQAIKKVGKKLIINAKAPDHVIEGIESTHHKYCLGIQWHPEFHVNSLDKAIFESFIKACLP